MINFFINLHSTLSDTTLLGIAGLLSGILFFLHRNHDDFRIRFIEFKKVFLPCFEMLQLGEFTWEQIIYREFPTHKEAITAFLHAHPLVWYRRPCFDKKWKEYETAYNDIYNFFKQGHHIAILRADYGTEKDKKGREQLLEHLRCLLNIIKQY